MLSQIDRHPFREVDHGRLGRAVDAHVLQRHESTDARDIDDIGTCAPEHEGQDGLRDEKDALEDAILQLIPLGLCRLEKRSAEDHAVVIDEHVDAAKRLVSRCGNSSDLIGVGHISDHRNRLATRSDELGRQPNDILFAIGQYEFRTRRGELARGHLANPACCSRQDDDPIFELACHCGFPFTPSADNLRLREDSRLERFRRVR